MHWMTNIQDWCISRQLWWGHRIPAWYCDDSASTSPSSRDDADARARSAAAPADARTRTSSTPGSRSALWPFSTLGWPDKTRELATFYPNNVLVTGPDIIFFWVARMMMMGLHFMGKVPFRTVYLTSIVTDENGDKMSKTKGNVIDPLDVVHGATLEKLLERVDVEKPRRSRDASRRRSRRTSARASRPMGADALRFALAALNTAAAADPAVDQARRGLPQLHQQAVERVAVRADEPRRLRPGAVRGAAGDAGRAAPRSACRSAGSCRACRRSSATVDAALEAFRFSDAANAIYHFVWDELCDWYIELAKPHLHQSAELEQDPREGGAPPRRAGRARDRARDHDAPAAPVRAVRHRGDLAEAAQAAAAAGLADDHGVPARRTPRGSTRRPRRRCSCCRTSSVASRMLRADLRRAAGAGDRRSSCASAADAPRAVITKLKGTIDRERASVKATIVATGGDRCRGAAKAMVGADVEI